MISDGIDAGPGEDNFWPMAPVIRPHPPVWVLVSAAWFGPATLAIFQALVQARLGHYPVGWKDLAWQGGDWLLCALLTPGVFWMARRFPFTRGAVLRRLPVHLVGAFLLCLLWAGAGLLLSWTLLRSTPYDAGVLSWFFTTLPFGVAVYFAVLGVEHAAFYFVQSSERETQAARLSGQLAEARLAALRMQLQPHFLFNSLNAVTVIVRDRDTATATRMLEQLGEMLRRVMRSDSPPEVPLEEELDFVRRYLAIEEVRFSDRLRPRFAVDRDLRQAAVPEFLLQPLVENALRHGLARRVGATMLEVAARREGDDLVLTVTDDGPGPGETRAGEGIGFRNTRQRLQTLYGSRAGLTLEPNPSGGEGSRVTVRLPYRELAKTDG
jgi:two-component system, LytTR family, sensor kinase